MLPSFCLCIPECVSSTITHTRGFMSQQVDQVDRVEEEDMARFIQQLESHVAAEVGDQLSRQHEHVWLADESLDSTHKHTVTNKAQAGSLCCNTVAYLSACVGAGGHH